MSAPAMPPAAGPHPSCQLLPDLSPGPGVQGSCRGPGGSACDLTESGASQQQLLRKQNLPLSLGQIPNACILMKRGFINEPKC